MAADAVVFTVVRMSAPELSVPEVNDPFPAGTADAGVYATHAEGFERCVVVLAMGEPCWLIEADGEHHLRVAENSADAVRHQLACYERECVGWPPPAKRDAVPALRRAPLSPWAWALSVFATFAAQGKRPDLTPATLLDATRVFDHGEWWRAGAALWLHADIGHLVANVGGGLLVFSAVVATFGAARGWLLLLASAVAGNLASAALHHGEPYRSLGASTMVFAALGLLTGRAVRAGVRDGRSRWWRALWVPLASGLVVLGLYGAGEVRTDVLAHATGFVAGCVIALFTRPTR